MHSNIHLRGIDDKLMTYLKKEALEQHTSVNSLILKLLKQSLGLTNQRSNPTYHDLDSLSGTWNKQEGASLLKGISDFEQIDKDLWK